MKPILKLLVLILCCTSLQAQNAEEKKVTEILLQTAADWSKGSIDDFMKAYWKNDSVTYVGKNGVTYGYNNILASYKKSFPDTSAMGKLSFDIIQVKQLSPDYCYVIGKYIVSRTAGKAEGHFTLLFKKIDGQWLIVSDHSS